MKLYKTTLIYTLFFLLIGFSFLSCRKQAEVSPEPEKKNWKRDARIRYGSANLIAGKAFEDALILAGLSNLTVHKGTSVINFSASFFDAYPPPIARNLHATPLRYPTGKDSVVFFRSNYTPVASPYDLLYINVKELGLGIKQVLYYPSDWGAFSNMTGNRVKFLMGCMLENNQNALLLLEIEHQDNYNPIILIDKKVIPLSGTFQYIYKIHFLDNNFYIYRSSSDSQALALRVSLNGDVRDLSPQIKFTRDFFRYGKDTLCHYTQSNEIDISTDNGLTWRGYAQGLPYSNWFFTNIKDKTLMVSARGDMLNLDLKNLKYQGVDIEGLPENLVNAVEYYNDTVYVSTSAGLYYKSYKDVLEDIKSKYE